MSIKFNWPKHFLLYVRNRAWALLFLSCLTSHVAAFDLFGLGGSEGADTVVVKVEEPFIEMHTGPGRGYPIFNVVEQGETIEILKRKTNWYKIRNADNKTGWTNASQLAHTLKPTGVPVDLPEVSRGDYLKSHWRVGFAGGSLEGASTFSVTAGYRPFSWGAELELEGGKIFDESVTSDYYGVNLLLEPPTDWLITPYVSVGGGVLSLNDRQKVVVDEAGSPSYVSFGAGASYYVVSNLVVRGGYRSYSISTDGDKVWLNAWTIGLGLFF
jgi:opacity protein-like surface antigen